MVHDGFDALEVGGVLCAITSQHWMQGSEKTCVDFRQWIECVNAEVHEIPPGVFKESGTEVATTAIKIKKKTAEITIKDYDK